MANKKITKIGLFFREDNTRAKTWATKISRWLKTHHPKVKIVDKGYHALVVLGGDGTILEAARICEKNNAFVVGLNLGTVGFLASSRSPDRFFESLENLFSGNYRTVKRMMLSAEVIRDEAEVFKTTALNEVVIINPLGMVTIEAKIDGLLFQTINGTGVLISTATGSTAYNLSAHGPVVTPNLQSFILTELWDHNIPTPSVVLGDNDEVRLEIKNFRKRELLSISETGQKVDLILYSDGEEIFPLKKGDTILIRKSRYSIHFVEFEKNYFLKSLREKFSFT